MNLINFGQQFGFIIPAWTSGYYLFPLARLLSHLSPLRVKVAKSVLEDLAEENGRDAIFQKPTDYWINQGLALFDERVTYVIKRRECILSGTKATLEEIGADSGVTRERVRQIEASFWEGNRLLGNPEVQVPFIKEILREVMMEQEGRLVASTKSSYLRFTFKCMGIPFIKIPNTDLAIIGSLQKDVSSLMKSLDHWTNSLDADIIAVGSKLGDDLCLSASDLESICKKVVEFRQKHLNKAQRIYLTLRSIGRPAHYSEVTAEYNHLFPDEPSIEHNVHAVLTREAYGVVWVGARGTFALEEWGYHRPTRSLFETVEDIVSGLYKSTGNPVPFASIVAEIGKYRQVVNPISVTIAAHCNPNLQRVLKDFFIPKDSGEPVSEEMSTDELDRILQDF